MNADLKKLVAAKKAWSEPLSAEEQAKGFKSWYASKDLPHCDFPGVRQFISYRLDDSMPVARRSEWEAFFELEDDREKQRKIQKYLDQGLGKCQLANPRVAEMVQQNLWHFDGVNYRLLAWILMPNHVHIAIEVWEMPMGDILKSWKGYTANEANKILGCSGSFWAEDYFDRRIRDENHFWKVVRYIENNPVNARLVRAPEDWLWSSARYRSKNDISGRTLTHPTANRFPPSRSGDGIGLA